MKSVVYFAQQGEDGPIKIGTTTNLERRLGALQTGSPVQIRIVAVVDGDRSMERRFHENFAEHRIAGEWFALHDVLRETIAILAAVERSRLEAHRRAVAKQLLAQERRARTHAQRLEVGQMLRASIDRSGLSRSAFARHIGVNEKNVRRMIAGLEPVPMHLALRMPSRAAADFIAQLRGR